jgi:DNA-binding IclR family transcriptional regulator
LKALEIIGDSASPITVGILSQQLGIHRSMGYRLVKTLETHGFVYRDNAGTLELGTRISSLARGVSKSLQAAAAPELARVAKELEMTAFLVSYDGEQAVTLASAEPLHAEATVAKKPGSRHGIDRGAPGRVIRSQVNPEKHPAQRFEFSQEEVLPGLAAIAVPLVVPGAQPAALAVLFLPQVVDQEHIADILEEAAQRIIENVG